MILIKIELMSAVDEKRNREIGRMVICNDGTGHEMRSDYIVQLMRRGTRDKVLKTAEVKDYPRLSIPVWHLVARALKNLGIR